MRIVDGQSVKKNIMGRTHTIYGRDLIILLL